jgi:hypothetical protein
MWPKYLPSFKPNSKIAGSVGAPEWCRKPSVDDHCRKGDHSESDPGGDWRQIEAAANSDYDG